MRKSLLHKKTLIVFLTSFIAFAFQVLPTQAQTNSSKKSVSDTVTVNKTVIDNCSKAFDELSVYDKLVEAKIAEITALREKIEIQKEKFELVRELAESRKNQADFLSEANNALKEAIAAKDKQLQNKETEIEILKKKRTSILTIFKAVGVGIGIGLILK